jgi:Family of unknown function (DUF5519)
MTDIAFADLPSRTGDRPRTTEQEIPHDQLDQFSPDEIRAGLLSYAAELPDVILGQSLVSEPSSIGLRLPVRSRAIEAFLHPTVDEFAHIHRAGFMHLTLPSALVERLEATGWAERHPITARTGFPSTIVMLYAPRDADELELAQAALRASYDQARAG